MSNGLKLLLLSAGTLITCMVVTLAMHMARMSQKTGEAFNGRLNEFYEEVDNSNLTMYDGLEVYGSDVVNFIKRQMGGYAASKISPVKVSVITSLSPYREYSYIDNTYVKEIQNFANERYINPLNLFDGAVIYNSNEVITEVIFTVK